MPNASTKGFNPHADGPLPVGYKNMQQFKKLVTAECTVTNSFKDGHVELRNGNIGAIKNIIFDEGNRQFHLVVHNYASKKDFYDYPCGSSTFGVFKISDLHDQLAVFKLEDVKQKLVVLPDPESDGSYVAFPLLHML